MKYVAAIMGTTVILRNGRFSGRRLAACSVHLAGQFVFSTLSSLS